MPRRFYITTAIDYVNGRPHLGHAYEKVLADALARFHRQRGDATFFLTGTDEHGQKILHAAEAAGQTPRAFTDALSRTFVDAWHELQVSYDRFVRTSEPQHEHAVQELFRRLWDARSPKTGQSVLFAQDYEGLYCEGCESFKQDKDLERTAAGKRVCPLHPTLTLREIRESNFFFRLSEYDDALKRHIAQHPEFIEPGYRRNEVLRVIEEGLQDVSVTRPNLPWGVPLPDEIPGGRGHTVYVWADALLNYLSAIGWPERRYAQWWLAHEHECGGPGGTRQDTFQDLDGQGRPGAAWAGTTQPLYSNALHVIGKDISRFHCVLWPAMLLAAGVPLPRQVYVHGFVYLRGERLSKSLGNLLDPVHLAQQFGTDAVRYYLLSAAETGRDLEFTIEQMVERVNVRLANEFGNLASRTMKLVQDAFGGSTPEAWTPEAVRDPAARAALEALIAAAHEAHDAVPRAWAELRIQDALEAAWVPVVRANEFVERTRPWELAKDAARRDELGTVLAALLETLRLVALWSWPAIPGKSESLWAMLRLPGRPGETRGDAAAPRFASQPARLLGEKEILFPRIKPAPAGAPGA
ncbi:MAG TPA: methionine--tRNA ligase [Candidatus Eisenbacteria bacterium]|nr:methionine--tRNA ligase [Candidatus Eisenbacteria bacterium]